MSTGSTGPMSDDQFDRRLTALLNEEAEDVTGAPTAAEMTLRVARRVPGGTTRARTGGPLRLALSLSLLLVLVTVAAVFTGQRPTVPMAQVERIVYTYTAPGAESHVFTMTPEGNDKLQLGSSPAMLAIASPDGTRLAVTQQQADGRWTSTVMAPDGSDPVTLPLPVDNDLNLSPLAWSPDGALLALEGWSETDTTLAGIYTATPAGHDLRLLQPSLVTGGHAVPIAWSPDGAGLLFLQLPDDGDRGELHVLDEGSTEPRRLSAEGQQVWLNGFNVAGSWSPDSGSVAYTAFDDAGRSAASVADASGGEPVQVSDWGTTPTGARFSPDGEWVLYDIAPIGSGRHDLWLVRPDGTDRRALTDPDTTGQGNCCGTWSPDGQHILFQNGEAEAAQLWIVSIDGRGARQVTTDAGAYSGYSWVPTAP